MTKQDFKISVKAPVSTAKTIMNLMDRIYETDMSEFFPTGLWPKGNPVLKRYNNWLDRNGYYTNTSDKKLYYKEVVKDLMKQSPSEQGFRYDIAYFLTRNCTMFLREKYIRNTNT